MSDAVLGIARSQSMGPAYQSGWRHGLDELSNQKWD